jgi:nickel transport protein
VTLDGLFRMRWTACGLTLAFWVATAVCAWTLEAQATEQPGALSADSPQATPAAAEANAEFRHLAALLEQQKSLISRETGQIKRELAALRDDLGKPGMREIFAGIGYIFGLAGVGLFVHVRRGREAGTRRRA